MLLDFSHNNSEAFVRGFIKGLAAPILLFGMFPAPPMMNAPFISLDSVTKKSINDDWNAIGCDFAKVISAHAQANQTDRPAPK